MEKLAKEARKNTLERNSKMMNNTDIANCLEVFPSEMSIRFQ
jgi:hypothetical protein